MIFRGKCSNRNCSCHGTPHGSRHEMTTGIPRDPMPSTPRGRIRHTPFKGRMTTSYRKYLARRIADGDDAARNEVAAFRSAGGKW